MAVSATISIAAIGNGYVVSDAANDPYGGSEWRLAEAIFYPTLDDLAADMGRFSIAAVEGAVERDREMRERQAREEGEFGIIGAPAQIRRAGILPPGRIG